MLLFFYCFRSSLYIKKTSYLLHFLANTFPSFFICFDFMIFFLDYEGFPDSSAGKESTCNGDPGLISGLGRSAGEGKGYPLQYSWASLVAQLVKNLPARQETWFDPWVGKIP